MKAFIGDAVRLLPAAASAISDLAVESGEVVECLDTRKEEIAATFYGREGGQTLYLSSDRPLRNSYVVAAVLSTDHRIAFIAQLVEIWVIYPNILREFELADETCADHECRNTALDPILGSAFR